ncbi:MAG: ABC transporter substrate-binding protein, partial [Kiloniellales bacterium]
RIKGAQLQEVADLLAALVVNNAAERLRELAVTGITVGKARALPNQDVLVKAEIEIGEKEPMKLGWRIADRDGVLKIVDIEVDGYSLRIHFQNLFERKLRYGGVDGLVKSLRNKVDDTPGLVWVQEAALYNTVVD